MKEMKPNVTITWKWR